MAPHRVVVFFWVTTAEPSLVPPSLLSSSVTPAHESPVRSSSFPPARQLLLHRPLSSISTQSHSDGLISNPVHAPSKHLNIFHRLHTITAALCTVLTLASPSLASISTNLALQPHLQTCSLLVFRKLRRWQPTGDIEAVASFIYSLCALQNCVAGLCCDAGRVTCS